MVRAKFRCEQIEWDDPTPEGNPATAQITFSAVTSGEGNESWSKWTPSGTLKMHVTNPDAVAQFEPCKEYYLDFIPAE